MLDDDFYRDHNAQQIVHPMSHVGGLMEDPPMIITGGDGVRVTDIDGNSLVDGVGGLWNVNVGYNVKEIQEAIIKQLGELHYYSSFNGTSNKPSIELADKLVSMTAQEEMARAFFSSGGSDAVESALRIARVYWKSEGSPERTKFISLKGGYHGTHFGAASVNGNTDYRRNFEPMLPGCFHVEAPYLYRSSLSDDPEELGRMCAALLENEIVFQGPDTVAAFIAEPVMGAGGVIVPPANYWPLVREVCDRHGVLLIADEVVTGFGRSGSMFGCRGWGVKPDMMTFAKGINSGYVPLGATMINHRISDVLERSDAGRVLHGYTYSGHPLACAAAIPNLDIVMREDLPTHAGERGTYFFEKLEPFIDRYNAVGDVRGKGLMLVIEMVKDKSTKEPMPADFGQRIGAATRAAGAMVRPAGHKIILSPPLIIDEDEIDIVVEALELSLIHI